MIIYLIWISYTLLFWQVVSQSSEVLEFVKKDIDEFTKVVSEEASSMVSSTATTLKEKLRVSVIFYFYTFWKENY